MPTTILLRNVIVAQALSLFLQQVMTRPLVAR